MSNDVINLFIGATIGILGTILGYFINHLLKVREQEILREFEIREKGRDFFHQIYGMVSTLGGFVSSFYRESSDKAIILSEEGYIPIPRLEVIKRYKEAYKRCTKSWYESTGKGLEVFLSKELARDLTMFWGYAGGFYENEDWDSHKKLLEQFDTLTQKICEDLDKMLGLSEKKSRKPKWLNSRYLKLVIRGEKLDQ